MMMGNKYDAETFSPEILLPLSDYYRRHSNMGSVTQLGDWISYRCERDGDFIPMRLERASDERMPLEGRWRHVGIHHY